MKIKSILLVAVLLVAISASVTAQISLNNPENPYALES